MVALLSIYEDEDEAYQDLVTVATTFFQYLLQPFRDMRELACLYKMEILVNTQTHKQCTAALGFLYALNQIANCTFVLFSLRIFKAKFCIDFAD